MNFSVDIEANGRNISQHSIISIGAVAIEPGLNKSFYTEMAPRTSFYEPESIAIGGFDYQQTLFFESPQVGIKKFYDWVFENSKDFRPILWADNPAFDMGFIFSYCYEYIPNQQLGWSGRRIGDFICGLEKDSRYSWKKLRKGFSHTHNAEDDARSNAHAMLKAIEKHNIKF